VASRIQSVCENSTYHPGTANTQRHRYTRPLELLQTYRTTEQTTVRVCESSRSHRSLRGRLGQGLKWHFDTQRRLRSWQGFCHMDTKGRRLGLSAIIRTSGLGVTPLAVLLVMRLPIR